MSNMVIWKYSNGKIDMDCVLQAEKYFEIKLPDDFVNCIIDNNGCYPKPNRFVVNGNIEVFSNLLSLRITDENSIVKSFEAVRDRLADKIIPFADDPFGNMLCFDYRSGNNPTIVFWEHEKAFRDKESGLIYVCSTFSELLSMLHESEDD